MTMEAVDGLQVRRARRLMRPLVAHLDTCQLCAGVVAQMIHPENLCGSGQVLMARLGGRFTPQELWMAHITLEGHPNDAEEVHE